MEHIAEVVLGMRTIQVKIGKRIIVIGIDNRAEADARFIVRAVNSHYELVEALKRLQHWVLPSDPDADIIRAALKKAGAE